MANGRLNLLCTMLKLSSGVATAAPERLVNLSALAALPAVRHLLVDFGARYSESRSPAPMG